MISAAIAERTPFDPLGAGGLLIGVLLACVGVGALAGWMLGGAGIGAAVGAVVGMPAGVGAVIKRYRGAF